MKTHTVKQGECLSSIGQRYGIPWQKIWDHNPDKHKDENNRKRDPNIIQPGEVFVIPDKEEKQESGATGQRHRIRLKGVTEKLMVYVNCVGKPRADEPYTIVVDGDCSQGTTNSEGLVEVLIHPNAKWAELTVGKNPLEQQIFGLAIGHLNPITEISGIQQRLINLGFECEVTGKMDQQTRDAISEFQGNYDIEITGDRDQKTLDDLEQESHSNPSFPSLASPDAQDGISLATKQESKMKKIAIMPGHGGADEGAVNKYYNQNERDFNWREAIELSNGLESLGHQVLICREENVDERLSVMQRRANKFNADVCFCLHHNALDRDASNRHYRGWGIYYHSDKSRKLAEKVRESFRRNLSIGPNGNGLKHATPGGHLNRVFNCIRSCQMPTVFLESCFIDHNEDCKWLLNGGWFEVVNALLEVVDALYDDVTEDSVLDSPFIVEPEINMGDKNKYRYAVNRGEKPTKLDSIKRLLRIRLTEGRKNVLKNHPYRLIIKGELFEGKTNEDGILEHEIAGDATDATLEFDMLKIPLMIARLDPIDSVKGIQARLNNLGYEAGPADGKPGELTEAAIRVFQRDEGGLVINGMANDKKTQDALKTRHGK